MTAIMQPIMDQARVPKSPAAWRNIIGEIAEEVAAENIGAKRLHTGSNIVVGNWICPDLMTDHYYGEVKAVGLSRNMIIYRVRLEKERHFNSISQKPLCYVLVLHRFGIENIIAGANKSVARFVIEFTSQVWVIPFSYVDAICQTVRPRILNHNYKPSNGWCQRGYELGGYSFPAKRLIQACPWGRIV